MKFFISRDLVFRYFRLDKHAHFTINNILPLILFVQNIYNNKTEIIIILRKVPNTIKWQSVTRCATLKEIFSQTD